MSATMSIHKLRMKAKQDRGQACLEYMQTRTSPVTLKELASKLGMTTKSISNSLVPLLEQGLIERELMLRQSSICKKLGWAYGYYTTKGKKRTIKALEKELKKDEKARKEFEEKRLEEAAGKESINYHNPFNMGTRP